MHTRLESLATARAESSVQRWEESRNWQRVTKYLAAAKTDLIFFVLIIVFGASAVLLHQRTADFWGEDVFYADAAHSLLHDGFYGVNGNPETTQPPGLPGILAVLFSIFGYSYAASAGAMAVVVTSLRDRRLARTRLLKYLPVLLVGIAVQGAWMHRKPAPSEWSLPGYPGSYLQQLKLKRGNYPELGMAKWSDIPDRVTTNLK